MSGQNYKVMEHGFCSQQDAGSESHLISVKDYIKELTSSLLPQIISCEAVKLRKSTALSVDQVPDLRCAISVNIDYLSTTHHVQLRQVQVQSGGPTDDVRLW